MPSLTRNPIATHFTANAKMQIAIIANGIKIVSALILFFIVITSSL